MWVSRKKWLDLKAEVEKLKREVNGYPMTQFSFDRPSLIHVNLRSAVRDICNHLGLQVMRTLPVTEQLVLVKKEEKNG